MREDDGRKLDHKTLEALRVRAVGQVEKGARVEDVAAGLGLNRSSVFKWVAAYHAGGKKALRARPVPGRPPKLSGVQTEEIYRAFDLFDQDHKGRIELQDLRRVAQELGEGLQEEELQAMIEEFDVRGEGGITREEFLGICLGN